MCPESFGTFVMTRHRSASFASPINFLTLVPHDLWKSTAAGSVTCLEWPPRAPASRDAERDHGTGSLICSSQPSPMRYGSSIARPPRRPLASQPGKSPLKEVVGVVSRPEDARQRSLGSGANFYYVDIGHCYMCGWPPVCKSFVREEGLIACSHVSRFLVRCI